MVQERLFLGRERKAPGAADPGAVLQVHDRSVVDYEEGGVIPDMRGASGLEQRVKSRALVKVLLPYGPVRVPLSGFSTSPRGSITSPVHFSKWAYQRDGRC